MTTTGSPGSTSTADLDADLHDAGTLLGRSLQPLGVLRSLGALGDGDGDALTQLVGDQDTTYVVRSFAPGDPAVDREVEVLGRVARLGPRVPTVLATDLDRDRPLVVTTRVAGAPPAPQASGTALAAPLADFLAELHALDADGSADGSEEVLSHGGYRSGTTAWSGLELTGVPDWSAARTAPRGLDLARCRLDLVLIGDPGAADVLVSRYERAGGHPPADLRAWDLDTATAADAVVESWATDFAALGRRHLTAARLRQRLDAWTARLEATR